MSKNDVFNGVCIGDRTIRATSGPHEGQELHIKSRVGLMPPKKDDEVTFEFSDGEAIFVEVKGAEPYKSRAWQSHRDSREYRL